MPNYISAIKLPNGDIYQIKDNGALQLTGGQVTGPVNFGDSVYISDLNAGTLIVTGNAAFTNNIQANTINGVEVGPNPKFTDTGTVTSVAVAAASNSGITVNGSPITSVGTITIDFNLNTAINKQLSEGTAAANRDNYAIVQHFDGNATYHRRKLSNIFAALNSTDITNALGGTQSANVVFAGPSSGSDATPSFRTLVSADLPAGTNSIAGAVKLGASGGAATYDHAHGSLSSAGIISTSTAIASGDKFVIIDSSDSNKIKGSTLTFGNSESSFLTNKGTWGTPPNTTYSFTGGTNQFVVTPSSGTASTITITPSITNNITGSGTSGYLVKFNGANSITTAAQLSSSGTGFLKQDGTWATPANTTYAVFVKSGSTAASGLVPKPPTTAGTVKFLRQDASWADLPEIIKLKGINDSGTAAVSSTDRPTTANLNYIDTSVRYFLATSEMEQSSKPTMGDSHILHFAWDNKGWNAQMAIGHGTTEATSSPHVQIRKLHSNQNWSDWIYLLDENNYTDYTVTKTGTGASGTWGIDITGNADTATKAEQDESGNNIKTNYASSLSVDGTTFTLKSKSGAPLSTVALTSANIPSLNASKITDGILPVARGGTGETSFSAGYLLYTPTTGSIKSTKFMHLNYKAGTTSTLGYEELILGNTTTEGTVDNAFGRIGLYSAKTKGSYITVANTTNSSWYDHVLPASAGWLVTGGSYNRDTGAATGVGSDTIPIYVSTAGRATAITKVGVAYGGTGVTSFTANSLIMSGTNTTAALTTRAISTSITADNSTNIPTESAVKTYVDNQIATIQGTVQGGYVTIAGNAQQVTGRKTLSNLAGASFKPAESSASCDISYNQSLGALVFSFIK